MHFLILRRVRIRETAPLASADCGTRMFIKFSLSDFAFLLQFRSSLRSLLNIRLTKIETFYTICKKIIFTILLNIRKSGKSVIELPMNVHKNFDATNLDSRRTRIDRISDWPNIRNSVNQVSTI